MTNDRCCAWGASGSLAMRAYHDTEWGVPTIDEKRLFEFLVLESAQAGLSWSTILGRREGYRKAFAGFDPETVASFGEADVNRRSSIPASPKPDENRSGDYERPDTH